MRKGQNRLISLQSVNIAQKDPSKTGSIEGMLYVSSGSSVFFCATVLKIYLKTIWALGMWCQDFTFGKSSVCCPLKVTTITESIMRAQRARFLSLFHSLALYLRVMDVVSEHNTQPADSHQFLRRQQHLLPPLVCVWVQFYCAIVSLCARGNRGMVQT